MELSGSRYWKINKCLIKMKLCWLGFPVSTSQQLLYNMINFNWCPLFFLPSMCEIAIVAGAYLYQLSLSKLQLVIFADWCSLQTLFIEIMKSSQVWCTVRRLVLFNPGWATNCSYNIVISIMHFMWCICSPFIPGINHSKQLQHYHKKERIDNCACNEKFHFGPVVVSMKLLVCLLFE